MEVLKTTTQPSSPKNKGAIRKIKTVKPKTNKRISKNIESMNLREINELIDTTREIKQNYSRSTTLSYVPLTKFQKLTMIEEMNTTSTNKLMKYSGIFNEIKNQITDLSLSLRTSFNEKKNTIKPRGSSKLEYYFNFNNRINEEIDEELISPSIQKTIIFQKESTIIDENCLGEVDEQKDSIIVNETQKNSFNNNKLFEKVKLRKRTHRQKILMQQNQTLNKQRRINTGLIEDDKLREEDFTYTNSNNLNQSKKDTINTTKTQFQSEETTVTVESCQCNVF